MRNTFCRELLELARKRPEIFLMVGDLGYSVVESFRDELPGQFLNAGVAEQNMTGVAAGMASEGYHVFTYSIANFPSLRCLEQIRNDVSHHRWPVTIVSVGAGLAYGNLGYSHHAVNDIGAIGALEGVRILSPASPEETVLCTRWLVDNPCPSYLRLGKNKEPHLHDVTEGFDKQIMLIRKGGGDIAIVGTGAVLGEAVAAFEGMSAGSCRPDIYSSPFLTPPADGYYSPLKGYRKIISIEEHVDHGGLASILRRELAPGTPLYALSLKPGFHAAVGSQEYLRTIHGLTARDIVDLHDALCDRP